MLGIKSMWGDAATHLTLFFSWGNFSESRRCRHGYRPKNKHNCMHSSGFLFGRATASWKPGPIWELRIKSRLKRRDCCTQRWETRGELLLNSPWLSVWILWVLKIGVKCILLWPFYSCLWSSVGGMKEKECYKWGFSRPFRSFCLSTNPKMCFIKLIHDIISPKHLC